MQDLESVEKYEIEGFAGQAVGNIVTLIVGVGVSVLVLIFVGTLGGQTYNIAEPKILNISDATIQTSVKNSIKSGFSALEQTGSYLPIIVLAVIISLVMALILGMGSGMMGNQGSAL